jgi:hypothetical protein|tara:strand:- start:1035 stop:1262 length:228 start_codon:yes stop_codon:yes gene_type:complete
MFFKGHRIVRCTHGFKCEVVNAGKYCKNTARWLITNIKAEREFNKKNNNKNVIDRWLCQRHLKIIYPLLYKKIRK